MSRTYLDTETFDWGADREEALAQVADIIALERGWGARIEGIQWFETPVYGSRKDAERALALKGVDESVACAVAFRDVDSVPLNERALQAKRALDEVRSELSGVYREALGRSEEYAQRIASLSKRRNQAEANFIREKKENGQGAPVKWLVGFRYEY